MDRHAVISIPHAYCAGHEAVEVHACDTVAVHAGRALNSRLRNYGVKTTVLVGDTDRREIDLNRIEASRTEYWKHLNYTLHPGDMLCDVHSYPGDEPYFQATWGRVPVVLIGYEHLNMDQCERMQFALQQNGVKSIIRTPEHWKDISLYAIIQHFGPRAWPAMMFEFNEDSGLTTLNRVATACANALVRAFPPIPQRS